MKEYVFKISGVHYAANPEAEAGQPDTDEMHVRTRELLSRIDRNRPLVSLFAEPMNIYNPDCIMALSLGTRIGRVGDECLAEAKSLLLQSDEPMLFANVVDVVIKEHGYLMVKVEADELSQLQPLQSEGIDWGMWLGNDMLRLPPDKQVLAEMEAYHMLKARLLPRIEEVEVNDLKIYLGIWLKGSCHDICRETRQARSLLISKLEGAERKEVRALNEPLKEQRTSICGRMALIERASKWWTERQESEEMQRLWLHWLISNEGLLWAGLRRIDEMLRQLPGELYLDIGKRDVVLSRLYYMRTPRKAVDAIITLLMLRELTCSQLGIEMKPMTEIETSGQAFDLDTIEQCILRLPTFELQKTALNQADDLLRGTAWSQRSATVLKKMFAKVKEQQNRQEQKQDKLADAVEKAANRPTTQNIYGDKNEFKEDAKMLKLTLPADADPAEIAMRIAGQQKQIEKKKDNK